MTGILDGTDPTGPEAGEMAERLRLALDVSGLGTWRWDIATDRVVWDERLEALYGFAPGTFPGTFEAYRDRIHPEDREQMLSVVDAASRDRRPYRVEHRVLWPDGTVRWVQGSGRVIVDDRGEVTGVFGCSLDVTDLMEARLALADAVGAAEAATERERAQRQRLEFIGRINEALSEAATARDVMEAVARSAVPRLGDWCLVYLVTDPMAAPEIVAAHADSSHAAWAHEVAHGVAWDPSSPVGMPAVIRTGQSEVQSVLRSEGLEELGLAGDRAHIGAPVGDPQLHRRPDDQAGAHRRRPAVRHGRVGTGLRRR